MRYAQLENLEVAFVAWLIILCLFVGRCLANPFHVPLSISAFACAFLFTLACPLSVHCVGMFPAPLCAGSFVTHWITSPAPT